MDREGPPLLTRTRQWTRPSPETDILFLILSSHMWQVSRAMSCHKMLELQFCTRYGWLAVWLSVCLCVLSSVSISATALSRYHHSFCECNSLNDMCLLREIICVQFLMNCSAVHSVEQKSIGLKFSLSRNGSHVAYSCHHNSSRFTFHIFGDSWHFSVFFSLQSITPHMY
jgi:hypothetical protein